MGLMTIGTELVPAEVAYSPTLDCHVRVGTHDIIIAKEVIRDYPLRLKGEIVLDVGANIGAFARRAFREGAAEVYCVEPDKGNISILFLNAPTAVLIDGAVSNREYKGLLYTTVDGLNSGQFTTVPEEGRPTIEVDFYAWNNLVDTIRPTVIKIDVEGAEYDFLEGRELPDCVRQIAMEIHLHRLDWRTQAKALVNTFKGWKCVTYPVLDAKWQCMGAWTR